MTLSIFTKGKEDKQFVMDGDTPITVEEARQKIKHLEEQRVWDESRCKFHQDVADEWESKSMRKLKQIEDLSDMVQAAEDRAEDLKRGVA